MVLWEQENRYLFQGNMGTKTILGNWENESFFFLFFFFFFFFENREIIRFVSGEQGPRYGKR